MFRRGLGGRCRPDETTLMKARLSITANLWWMMLSVTLGLGSQACLGVISHTYANLVNEAELSMS